MANVNIILENASFWGDILRRMGKKMTIWSKIKQIIDLICSGNPNYRLLCRQITYKPEAPKPSVTIQLS
jgi:hypothetical protein